MSPLRVGWVLVLAALCLAAGIAGGFELRALTSPAPGTPSSVLSITAAGTLATLFPEVGRALANVTPGVSAPAASEQFEGSLAALSAISSLHEPFDVAAAADFRLIPSMLEPTDASWEVVFATTPEVLCYDPSVPAFTGINSTNWAEKVVAPGVLLGVANQSTDPNGYNGIFTLELEGQLENGSLSSLYSHFYMTPVGGWAEPSPTTTRVEPETQVATLLSTHVVSAFITYRSYAVSHQLSFVTLDPRVGLGATDAADVAAYAAASTTILGASGPDRVTGAPVLFAVTVPLNAPDPGLGNAFVEFLFSPAGASLIAANGFSPVSPGWADRTGALPLPITTDAVALPGSLQALLP
ncbi:MAG TPA: substrate-binding domain-containing protein [Thermoplasmata archaeon]|nr:substrate-binding domain-containing protein [Thermoplasmata archaeon]